MEPRRHVVISGTGRAGTTFLVELLTHLGLDTGFSIDETIALKHEVGRAGLEHDIRNPGCPFIVKSPSFCEYAGQVVNRQDILIEHLFIPIRDLHAAAESRRQVSSAGSPFGGLWHTASFAPGQQEKFLLARFYHLMHMASGTDIPVTLLGFPRITQDATYLFKKLQPIIPGIAFTDFQSVFSAVVRTDLVHRFNERDC
jgi:hypothetical protein